ncbi:unnamed protein product [Colias eurytheme]|nr:unnamed protein product [Colias eurytheme]
METRHQPTDNCQVNLSPRKSIRFDIGSPKTIQSDETKEKCKLREYCPTLPTASELKQYLAIVICGLSLWTTSWFIFGKVVLPGGYIFNMAALVLTGYIFGHTLERYTKVNAVVGMVLVGTLSKIFLPINILGNDSANVLDYHLRRIYPVIILTKGPLTWNWDYIKHNSVKVFTLATLPWIIECLSTAFFTFIFLEFPWYWGLHLGAILASVSPAVVVPTLISFDARGLGTKSNIALLVGNAGGLDTAFTEGMFGVINSAIFYESAPVYRVVKAFLAIFVGIVLGIVWGVLADVLPDHDDVYAATIRSLHIFAGGLLISYACGYFGWGGTSGVAIMVCAAAAATRWARRGWPLNNNPVSEVYKLLWRIFEAMLFTLSGSFFEISDLDAREFGLMVVCIFLALILRLLTAFLIALSNELPVKECIFIAITWIPKAIVEAVLVRVASDSLWREGTTDHDRKIATQHSNMIIIAILLTTTIGSILTTVMGPILLSPYSGVAPEELVSRPRSSSTESTPSKRSQQILDSFQYIDMQ